MDMLSRRDFGIGAVTGAGALAALASAPAQAQTAANVSINVLYPNHAGAKFDLAYYRSTHIPLAMKVMKADSVKLIEGVTTPAGPPPFAMIAHFTFSSLAKLQTAAGDPAMADVRADIAKFTDIKPVIMIGHTI